MKGRWDKYWEKIPPDLRHRCSIHDFRRLGEIFKTAFDIDSRDRRIAELEAALGPFAEQADNWDDVSQLNAHRVEPEFLGISVDQLRKARSALTPGEKS